MNAGINKLLAGGIAGNVGAPERKPPGWKSRTIGAGLVRFGGEKRYIALSSEEPPVSELYVQYFP